MTDVEVGGRFVKDENFWFSDEPSCNRDLLMLACRKLIVSFHGQIQQFKEFQGAFGRVQILGTSQPFVFLVSAH